jgi:methylated-DNA-protein-cysteine methyltransferase-like protein
MPELTELSLKIIHTIKKIPKGKVATYAQVARLSGRPKAIRRVVWILHACSKSHDLPWHRVLNAKGKIAFPEESRHFCLQKNRLMKEGIKFNQNQIDLKKFGWKKQNPLVSPSWELLQKIP